MNKLKLLLVLIVVSIAFYASYNTYCYFFDYSIPRIEIAGIESEKYYKGEIVSVISLHDDYKVQEVNVLLDGNPLGNQERIGKADFEYQLVLPTKSLSDGLHALQIEVVDGSYNKNKSTKETMFFVDNKPLHAAFVKTDTDFKVFQGRTLHLQFQVSKDVKKATIEVLGQIYDCCSESPRSKVYECFVPIACEETPNEYLFSINVADEVGNTLTLQNKFQIVAYPFKKQQINVSDEKIQKEAEGARTHEDFEKTIQELTDASPHKKLWQGQFIAPTDVKNIGAEFGIQRTSQQRGRYIHQGLDVLNAPRSVVWASQSGVVVLKDRFEISGNTVVIDHGCGILSMFFHLEEFAKIEEGDEIKKGNPVGKIGNTGYATGYHLHWEMRINNIPVDPLQWTKNDF